MERKRYYINSNFNERKYFDLAFSLFSDYPHQEKYFVVPTYSYKSFLVKLGYIKHEDENIIQFEDFECEIINLKDFIAKRNVPNTLLIHMNLADELLFSLEEVNGVEALIVLSQFENDIDLWKKTYAPFDVLKNEFYPKLDIQNQLLKKELEQISKSTINNSMLHTKDEELLKSIISKYKNQSTKNEIFAYMKREKKMKYKDCVKLMNLVI